MNHEKFDQMTEDTFQQMREILKVKGGEYAGDTDRFENFKRNGLRLGLHPMTIWAVYFNKHVDAINQYVSDLQNAKERPRGEAMDGRFVDAMNYLMLGLGMLKEGIVQTPTSLPKTIIYPPLFGKEDDIRAYWSFLEQGKGDDWKPWPEELQLPFYHVDTDELKGTLGIPENTIAIRRKTSAIGSPERIWKAKHIDGYLGYKQVWKLC